MKLDLSLAGVPRTETGLLIPRDVVFYYLRGAQADISTTKGAPRGCACIGKVGRIACRGVSFCLRRDQFDRNAGRELAYRRYLLARATKKSTEAVERTNLRQLLQDSGLVQVAAVCFKSAHNCKFTGMERRLWFQHKKETDGRARLAPKATAAKLRRMAAASRKRFEAGLKKGNKP